MHPSIHIYIYPSLFLNLLCSSFFPTSEDCSFFITTLDPQASSRGVDPQASSRGGRSRSPGDGNPSCSCFRTCQTARCVYTAVMRSPVDTYPLLYRHRPLYHDGINLLHDVLSLSHTLFSIMRVYLLSVIHP